MQFLFLLLFAFISSAFATDDTQKAPKPFQFSLVGACEIALLPIEGAPSTGFVFLLGTEPDQDQVAVTRDVNLKPGESKIVPLYFGVAASNPYLLVSLNRVSSLGSADGVITGHKYLLTVALGLDHDTNFPQDPFRFAFSGTSTHSKSFTVRLNGSVQRNFYTYQPDTEKGQKGFRYDFGNESFPSSFSFSFLLLHDPRYGASIGGSQFIPELPSRAAAYQAVQRFHVKLGLEVKPLNED